MRIINRTTKYFIIILVVIMCIPVLHNSLVKYGQINEVSYAKDGEQQLLRVG